MGPRVLAVEPRNGQGRVSRVQVVEKMDQTLGEHKGLAGLQVLSEHAVGRVDKAHEQRTLEASGHLGGPGMGVRWHDPIGRYVDSGQDQAQGVEPGEINGVGESDAKPELVAASVPGLAQNGRAKMDWVGFFRVDAWSPIVEKGLWGFGDCNAVVL